MGATTGAMVGRPERLDDAADGRGERLEAGVVEEDGAESLGLGLTRLVGGVYEGSEVKVTQASREQRRVSR